jgi:hypothetical protein
VELIGSATAIALDAQTALALPDGSLVLVCDLGESWSTALLRVYQHEVVPIAQETVDSGRDLDVLLLNDLRAQSHGWIDQLLSLPGDEGHRALLQAMDFVRQIKHELSDLADDAEVAGRLAPDTPLYTLKRERLDRLAEPGLRWVGASCRSLLARAAAGWRDSALAGAIVGGTGLQLPPGSGSVQMDATLADVEAVIVAGSHAA